MIINKQILTHPDGSIFEVIDSHTANDVEPEIETFKTIYGDCNFINYFKDSYSVDTDGTPVFRSIIGKTIK